MSNAESAPTEYRADVERGGIRVSLEIHIGGHAMFPDQDELGEIVGATAVSTLRTIEQQRTTAIQRERESF